MGLMSEAVTGLSAWQQNMMPASMSLLSMAYPNGDEAGASLCYALLYPRLKDREDQPAVSVVCHSISNESYDTAAVVNAIAGPSSYDRCLRFEFISSSVQFWTSLNEMNNTEKGTVFQSIVGLNYTELVPVERAIKQESVEAIVLQQDSFREALGYGKTVVLVKGAFTQKRWHTLMSFFPILFPCFFVDKRVDQDEVAFCKSLLESTSDRFIKYLKFFEEKYDYRKDRIVSYLTGFTKSHYTRRIKDLTNDIQQKESYYEGILQDATHVYREIEEKKLCLQALVIGGDGTSPTSEQDLIDYVVRNRGITVNSANNGRINFTVVTYLNNYDADMAERLLANVRSFYHDDSLYANGASITPKSWRKLLKAIFVDEKFKIRMKAGFDIDFARGQLEFSDGYLGSITNAIPNPHLVRFHCLGGNGKAIHDAIKSYDYLGAINSCVVATGNLNVGEMPNVRQFIHYLLRYSDPIEVSPGEFVGLGKAIKLLEEKEGGTI